MEGSNENKITKIALEMKNTHTPLRPGSGFQSCVSFLWRGNLNAGAFSVCL